jgi:hypothetical protein
MRRLIPGLGALVIVFASFATGRAQAATGTAALWKMNETSGTTMHDSASDGTQDNGTLRNVTVGQPGAHGRAYRFNGPELSYVSVPDSPDINPVDRSFTFSVMVQFTQNPSGDYDLLRKGLSTTPGGDYKTEIAKTGQAICEWKGSSATKDLIGGSPLNDGVWHTITCKKTAGKVTLRVDGTVRASSSVTIGTISNSADLLLGAKSTSGGDQYQGLMDRAKIAY